LAASSTKMTLICSDCNIFLQHVQYTILDSQRVVFRGKLEEEEEEENILYWCGPTIGTITLLRSLSNSL
jgi:hypothetical protein